MNSAMRNKIWTAILGTRTTVVKRKHAVASSAGSCLSAVLFTLSATICAAEQASAVASASMPPVGEALAPVTGGGGLCVVLGATEEQAPMLDCLAEGRRMLIHVLAADRESADKLRRNASECGYAGQVSVEYPLLNPLPYCRHMADAVVVPRPEILAKTGVGKDELTRIAAPEADVFTLVNGAWTREKTPRPAGLDVWTHARHDPGDAYVSHDKEVTFPGGLRWVDGVPSNLDTFISTRTLIADERRVFTLTPSEPENVGRRGQTLPMYLVARSAFSGLVLWKRDVGYQNPASGALLSLNTLPLVCDGKKVYCAIGTELQGLDGATGATLIRFPNRWPVLSRIFVMDGVLVAAPWTERASPGARSEWFNGGTSGAVQGFDTATGKVLWEHDLSAQRILGADGLAYVLAEPAGSNMVTVGNSTTHVPASQELVAIEVAGGKIRWRVPHTAISPAPTVRLMLAGAGIVLVTKTISPPEQVKHPNMVRVALSARDGSVLWEQPHIGTYLVGNELLEGGGVRRDPLTGKVPDGPKGAPISGADGRIACTPDALVANRWAFAGRLGRAYDLSDLATQRTDRQKRNGAARAPCGVGFIPANGVYYCAQNACGCCPTQIRGLLAFGAMERYPTTNDFESVRPVERGPAFGSVTDVATGRGDWPEFLGNAERSNRAGLALEGELKVLWTAYAACPTNARARAVWETLETSAVTPAVCAYGMAFVAVREAGEVVALDLATGQERWRRSLGARVRLPPSLGNGHCFVGTGDGWVQALRAKDGALAWRARAAPLEQRMLAFGRVESPWPVPALCLHDGKLYAVAGRNSEIGGVGMVAFDPATGATLWGKHLDRMAVQYKRHPPSGFQGDIPVIRGGKVCVSWMALEPADGRFVEGVNSAENTPTGVVASINGLANTAESVLQSRNAGAQFRKVGGKTFAWDDKRVYCINDRLNAFDREEVDAAKPEFLWQVVASPQALAVCEDRLAIVNTLHSPKAPPESWLEILDSETGKSQSKTRLGGSAAVNLGLAIAQGRALVSFEDGRVVCVGAAR
jgi:outer membrane protein assembly factor BamB